MSTQETPRATARSRGLGAVGALVALLVVTTLAAPAAFAKRPKACRLLKPAQMEKVLGQPVTGPTATGAANLSCSFDLGPGLGESGGALVTVQHYKGVLARNVYSAIKQTAEQVTGPKLLWDAGSGIAYGYRKGKLTAVSVTYTDSALVGEEFKAMVVQLAKLAANRL